MRIIDLRNSTPPDGYAKVLPRPEVNIDKATEIVAPILVDVQTKGAAALYALSERFDGVRPPSLAVPQEKIHEAFVYHRENQDCLVCGEPIRMRVLQGRALFWCGTCQR